MSETKFTPGPWVFRELTSEPVDGLGYIEREKHDGKEIAHHGDMGRSRDENRANGNLIAAAPELYEALQWMVDNDETNEGDEPLEHLRGQTWNQYNAYFIEGLNKARAALRKARGEHA